MSSPATPPPRRPDGLARDKPQVERAEHANLDRRPGAHRHPNARRMPRAPGPATRQGWR